MDNCDKSFAQQHQDLLHDVDTLKNVSGAEFGDIKVKTSANDPLTAYLIDKVSATPEMFITEQTGGVSGNYLLFSFNVSGLTDEISDLIQHNSLSGVQGGVTDEYYHLTSQELIDLTSGVYADNQHLHNASAISVDDSSFVSISGSTAQEVFGSIDSLLSSVSATAEVTFLFNRQNNVGTNTYLFSTNAASNISGHVVPFSNAKILKLFTGTENLDTYDIGIYSHDGDSVNLTLEQTVSVSGVRHEVFDLNTSITKEKHLALRITSGSCRNINAGLLIRGNIP